MNATDPSEGTTHLLDRGLQILLIAFSFNYFFLNCLSVLGFGQFIILTP